jgi:hypothetical protein
MHDCDGSSTSISGGILTFILIWTAIFGVSDDEIADDESGTKGC